LAGVIHADDGIDQPLTTTGQVRRAGLMLNIILSNYDKKPFHVGEKTM
jgi:hypothetical protein